MYRSIWGIGEMIISYRERLRRPAYALFALLCLAIVVNRPASAETEDVFTVRDVPVDATANEAAEARVIAIRRGRSTALRILFQRLTLQVDWPELPALETAEVTALGAGFEISNERNSPTRYLATISYRFKPQDVREILQQFDIPFSEVQARPMVVLPVFVQGQNARIFQDDHNWSFAWSNKNFAHELVPVKVPLGDLGDVIATPIEAAMTDDYAALSEYSERYGVQDILIVRMMQKEPDGFISFQFVRLSPTESETWTMTVPNTRHKDPLMQMAIERGLSKLQEDWKGQTIIRFDSQDTMVVSARFEEISQWLVIKRAMQGTPNIMDSRLVALSTGGAHMEWDVVGSPGQLALALAQHGVALEPARRGDSPGYEEEPDGLEGATDYPDPWESRAETEYPTPWNEPETSEQWDQAGTSEYDPFGTVEAETRDRVSGEDPDPMATVDDWASDVLETLGDPESEDTGDEDVTTDTLETDGEDGALEDAEPREPLDPGAALALLPVATKGGFFAATSDTQGVDFGNINPDFWIVRFAPKVEPEVWPTEAGDPAEEASSDAYDSSGASDKYKEDLAPDLSTSPDGAF